MGPRCVNHCNLHVNRVNRREKNKSNTLSFFSILFTVYMLIPTVYITVYIRTLCGVTVYTRRRHVSLKGATLSDTWAKPLLGLRYQQMAFRRTKDWHCLQLPSSWKRSWKSCLPRPCMVLLLFFMRCKDSCIIFDAPIVMMELVPPTLNKKDVPTLDNEAWLHFLFSGRGYCNPRSPRKQC